MKIEIVRPEDLLNLQIETVNLQLEEDALAVSDSAQPAFLIVTFPPQTIAERAYFEAAVVKPEQGPVREDPDAGSKIRETLDAPGLVTAERPTAAQLGHPTRLVFLVRPEVRVPFTVAGLLDWSPLVLQVNPIAAIGEKPSAQQIASAPAIREPTARETAIELPYQLVISPTPHVAWDHRAEPFTRAGRTELWHTRLQMKGADGAVAELSQEVTAPFRAIWSPDYHTGPRGVVARKDPDLQRTAMAPDDRYQIVILTSAFHGYESEIEIGGLRPVGLYASSLAPIRWKTQVPFVPQPFHVEQLMLSPLGGWLRSRGNWNPPHVAPPPRFRERFDLAEVLRPLQLRNNVVRPRIDIPVRDLFQAAPVEEKKQLDLSEWVHIATQGRDHYVRIVYEGELWPFRHRAALIKVTERKFRQETNFVGAYLVQRMFIVVREPEKSFAKDERGMPFKNVRLTTLVTPDIAEPKRITNTDRSFWVEVLTPGREFFQWHAVGTDIAGDRVDFTTPLMFVSKSDVEAHGGAVAKEYNDKKNIARRTMSLPGQKLTFAEPTEADGNTQLVTKTLNFVVNAAGTSPRMLKAEVRIPQVEQVLGSEAPATIRFFEKYVAQGIEATNGVFAEIAKEDLSKFAEDNPLAAMVEATLGVKFSADQAGGFATPNMNVSTLSRTLGPLAGKADDAMTDTFKPADYFPGLSAKLFGSLDLVMLLTPKPSDPVPPAPATMSQNAPKLRTRTEPVLGGRKVIADLEWKPMIYDVDVGVVAFMKNRGGRQTELLVEGHIEKAPGANGATFDFTGTLNDFRVSVLKQVFINFESFSFRSRSGAKPDVKVALDPGKPIEFAGDLKFVEELRKAIPPGLFGDGPSLDISPEGIRAGFAFALPPIAVGVFALKDVSLGAALTLPFLDGKPVFDFNVSERAHPFLLAVSLFGGGGFFHLQLDTAGIKQLEASFEFGATAAIDIGVASGEVHIFAGIYFSLQRKEPDNGLECTLSGYLRLGGSLSVLGLVHVSVEFNLSFTYVNEKAYGRATLTVQVSVLGLSKSVELTVERGFGGSSGDPTFAQLYDTPEIWSDYALAFA